MRQLCGWAALGRDEHCSNGLLNKPASISEAPKAAAVLAIRGADSVIFCKHYIFESIK